MRRSPLDTYSPMWPRRLHRQRRNHHHRHRRHPLHHARTCRIRHHLLQLQVPRDQLRAQETPAHNIRAETRSRRRRLIRRPRRMPHPTQTSHIAAVEAAHCLTRTTLPTNRHGEPTKPHLDHHTATTFAAQANPPLATGSHVPNTPTTPSTHRAL